MPCRKFHRRNAIYVIVPFNKPQVYDTIPEDGDWSTAYTFASTTNDDAAAYSPASRPTNSIVPCDMHLRNNPGIFMESENDDKDVGCFSRALSSLSSTLLSSAPVLPFQDNNNIKRHVRFDESRNQTYRNRSMCKASCKPLWYSGEENRRFRASHAAAINEIAVVDEMRVGREPFSYRKVLQRTYEACCRVVHETEDSVLTAVEQEHLKQCQRVHVARLGMECTMAIRSIANEQRFRYHELLNVVTHNPSDRDEFLREVCEELSRPSRLFARHLAQAQADV